MKKYVLTLFALILLAGTSCQEKIDIEKEKEAIKAVIEEEKNAYFDRDITRIGATWVQDPTSRKMFLTQEGLIYLNGWSEVNQHDKESVESDEWEGSEDIMAHFSDYEINIYNNTALVFCNTKWTGKYKEEEISGEQKRILHFVKVDGVWKYDLMAMYSIPAEEEIDEGKEEPETEDTE